MPHCCTHIPTTPISIIGIGIETSAVTGVVVPTAGAPVT